MKFLTIIGAAIAVLLASPATAQEEASPFAPHAVSSSTDRCNHYRMKLSADFIQTGTCNRINVSEENGRHTISFTTDRGSSQHFVSSQEPIGGISLAGYIISETFSVGADGRVEDREEISNPNGLCTRSSIALGQSEMNCVVTLSSGMEIEFDATWIWLTP
jgi:hypothetical protein